MSASSCAAVSSSRATLEEVGRQAEAIEPRYRLLVLLAVFGSLRWGELLGLRKSDFDLDAATV